MLEELQKKHYEAIGDSTIGFMKQSTEYDKIKAISAKAATACTTITLQTLFESYRDLEEWAMFESAERIQKYISEKKAEYFNLLNQNK